MAPGLSWGCLLFSGGVSELDPVEDCEDTDSLLPIELSSGPGETFSEDGGAAEKVR